MLGVLTFPATDAARCNLVTDFSELLGENVSLRGVELPFKVLLIQVENEYGYCGSSKAYLQNLIAVARATLGQETVIFTTDPPYNVGKGSLAGDKVYTCVLPSPLYLPRKPTLTVASSCLACSNSNYCVPALSTLWFQNVFQTLPELAAADQISRIALHEP